MTFEFSGKEEMDYSYSYSISNSPRQDSSFIFDSMPTRSGIHIMCGISVASSQVEFHFEWASASCSRTVPSIPIPFSSIPSRLTRHSVRASAIASPETSQSRGVTGFGTGCGTEGPAHFAASFHQRPDSWFCI